MRLPDPSPVLDKNCAPVVPEILSSTGAGVRRKAPMAFPDSSSVLDKFQSAKKDNFPTSFLTGTASGGTSRTFGGVRTEVSGRGPKLLRSCLGVEISIRKPSEAKF